MEKIKLSADVRDLCATEEGKKLYSKICQTIRPRWAGLPVVGMPLVWRYCGPMAAMQLLPYCGENGRRVCRLIATDIAATVVRSFEENGWEDARLRDALALLRAFADGEADAGALAQAMELAEEAVRDYEPKKEEEPVAETGFMVANVLAAAAAEDAEAAMHGACFHCYFANDAALGCPGAWQGVQGALGSYLRQYVAGLEGLESGSSWRMW